jgi:cyclin B
MKHSQQLFAPKIGYMEHQKDINEKMRAILVDWLIEVHSKFNLREETLFLTINLIDRYLEKVQVPRSQLQLVGVTALNIASKYEEIYAPQIGDFAVITDKAVSKRDILQMEFSMITALDFNVNSHSSFRFLERLLDLSGTDQKLAHLALYLIELPLIEYQMLKYSPLTLAASAVFLANKILQKKQDWPSVLEEHSGFKKEDLAKCAGDLCILLRGIESCTL